MRPIKPQAIIIAIPDTDFQRFWDEVSSLVELANLIDKVKPIAHIIINTMEVVIIENYKPLFIKIKLSWIYTNKLTDT